LLFVLVLLRGENLHTVAAFTISAGQWVTFDLTWTHTHHSEPGQQGAAQNLYETEDW
jgi:hypothetical protein